MKMETMGVSVLDFSKSGSNKKWERQTICVIGGPKIGKSELFAAGDGSLFLDIEGGLSHLDVMKFPKDHPFIDYDELESTLNQLVVMKQAGKFPTNINALIFDTATRLTQLASDKAVEILNRKFPNKNWETIEEISLGGTSGSPGWQLRSNLVDSLLGKAKQLGVCVVIIAHMEHRKVKNEMMVEIDKQTIDIGGQLGKAYLRYSDHILNIISKNDGGIITRTVRALPTATIEAGSRGLCVPDNWVLENPKARTREAMQEAAKSNYAKLRSFFE
jgi:hypothetical protein